MVVLPGLPAAAEPLVLLPDFPHAASVPAAPTGPQRPAAASARHDPKHCLKAVSLSFPMDPPPFNGLNQG